MCESENKSFTVQCPPYENIDRYEARANPKATIHYGNTPVSCHVTYWHQLVMIGRPHTHLHIDEQNAVNRWLDGFLDLDNKQESTIFKSLIHSKGRIAYFKKYY